MVRIFLIALSLLALANPQGLVGGVIRGSGGGGGIAKAVIRARVAEGQAFIRLGVYTGGNLVGYSSAATVTSTSLTDHTVTFSPEITPVSGTYYLPVFNDNDTGSLRLATSTDGTYSSQYSTASTYPTFPAAMPSDDGYALGDLAIRLTTNSDVFVLGVSDFSAYTFDTLIGDNNLIWKITGYAY